MLIDEPAARRPLYMDYGEDWPPPPPARTPTPRAVSRGRRVGRALRPYGLWTLAHAGIYVLGLMLLPYQPPHPYYDHAEPPAAAAAHPAPCSVASPCERRAPRRPATKTPRRP